MKEATKLLGSLFTPVGDLSAHVDEMLGKGYKWVDALTVKPMARQDSWMSMFHQLYPGMKWGMVSVTMLVKEMDKRIGKLY